MQVLLIPEDLKKDLDDLARLNSTTVDQLMIDGHWLSAMPLPRLSLVFIRGMFSQAGRRGFCCAHVFGSEGPARRVRVAKSPSQQQRPEKSPSWETNPSTKPIP